MGCSQQNGGFPLSGELSISKVPGLDILGLGFRVWGLGFRV